MKTIEFILPIYYASYFINCDASGLTDDELTMIDKFESENIKKYGTFYCLDADIANNEFSFHNDMPGMRNIGSDVCKYTFKIAHPEYKNQKPA